MKYSILDKSHDPMGAAISDFSALGQGGSSACVVVDV